MENVISIIVPVYNVSKYLEQCVRSLMNQTYRNIEIICINDGSKDNSLDILYALQAEDERIIVIDKDNTGYGDTINTGFKVASGKYIGIVESDDFAEVDMYEKLILAAERFDADVVKANFYEYNTSAGNRTINEYLRGMPYDELIESDVRLAFLGPVIWGGIYKREFLKNNDIWILDTPGASYQDTAFCFKVMISAKRAVLIKDSVINYRIDNNESSVKSEEKIFCIVDEMRSAQQYLIDKGMSEKMPVLVRTKFYRYKWNLDRLSGANKLKFLCLMHDEFETDEKKGFLLKEYWNIDDWIFVHRLIYDYFNLLKDLENGTDPKIGLAEETLNTQKKILSNIKDIYIYGAGIRAKKIKRIFEENNINIKGFIVSEKEDTFTQSEGIPVLLLSESREIVKESLIVVGVSERYRDEVIKAIIGQRLNNYIDWKID